MMGPLFPITSLKTRVETLEGANYEFTFWREVSTATGTITKPLGSTILLDRWPADIDAVVSVVATGKVPDEEHAYTASGDIVTTTLNTAGAFALSAAPSSYPVAIIGRASCSASAWKAMIDSGEILLGFAKIDDGTSGINYSNPIAANATGTITPVDGAYYTSTSKLVTLTSTSGQVAFTPLGVGTSGTTTSTSANKLVLSTAAFDTDGTVVGDTVHNTTDSTDALITAIDSDTTLSIDADIMVSGEDFRIIKASRIIWGTGTGAAITSSIDPSSLGVGGKFAYQCKGGESRVVKYDGTDFLKIGGVEISQEFCIYNTANQDGLTIAEFFTADLDGVIKDNASLVISGVVTPTRTSSWSLTSRFANRATAGTVSRQLTRLKADGANSEIFKDSWPSETSQAAGQVVRDTGPAALIMLAGVAYTLSSFTNGSTATFSIMGDSVESGTNLTGKEAVPW